MHCGFVKKNREERGISRKERNAKRQCLLDVVVRKSHFPVVLWAIKSLNASFSPGLLFRFKCELITMKYLTTQCLLMDQLTWGSATLHT